MSYTEDLEPVATEEEVSAFLKLEKEEEEEEIMLTNRFSGASSHWCSCGKCHLEFIVRKEECFCCAEIPRCADVINESEIACITDHPGFKANCLNKYVLEVASIGLKTRKNRRYDVLRAKGLVSESEFLRSVAYRQFFRFIYKFTGNSKRLPVPSCAYNAIRGTFLSSSGAYKGFIEDDEEVLEEGSNTDSD